MQACRFVPMLGFVATLAACSPSGPAELSYSNREFKKRAEHALPNAVVYVYTPGGIAQDSADEHLNFIRQTNGVSNVLQVMPSISNALASTGYGASEVRGRDDAFCAWRVIPDGAERIVTVVAARGERTVQIQHVARNRAENGMDTSCDSAAEVASLLDLTLASVP